MGVVVVVGINTLQEHQQVCDWKDMPSFKASRAIRLYWGTYLGRQQAGALDSGEDETYQYLS